MIFAYLLGENGNGHVCEDSQQSNVTTPTRNSSESEELVANNRIELRES